MTEQTANKPNRIFEIGRLLLPFLPALLAFAFLWLRGISPYNVLQAAFWPMVFLLQLWFFLAPVRTVTIGEIANTCVLGMTITTHLIWLSAALLEQVVQIKPLAKLLESKAWFGNTNLTDTLVAPVTEEFWKAAVPILLILLWNRLGKEPMAKVRTPVDFMILTAASGAGFSIYENLWRALNDDLSILWPKFASEISWRVGPFRFFPEMYGIPFYRGDMIWMGHAATAAAVGIAFGLFHQWRKKVYPVVLPIIMLLLVTWDHLLWNLNIHRSKIWWKATLGNLTLHGRLVPFIAAAMLLVGIWLAWRRVQWYKTTRNAHRAGMAMLNGLNSAFSYAGTHRYVLMASFGLWNALQDGKKNAARYAPFIGSLVRRAAG